MESPTSIPVCSEKKEKTDWQKMNFGEKFKFIRSKITVEPMLACYIMPSVLAGLATQNLNLEKACRVNLNYGPEICDALTRRDTANYTKEEQEVQQLVAGMVAWKTIIQSALPCMLILFWGSWSDRHGRRKPCIIIPIVGEFITALGLILCTYFERVPMEVAGITESLFPGLTGGWFTMLMGVFSYVADVTTEEERTLRIGIVNLFFSLGVPIGMAINGILLKIVGFYGIFSISAVLYLIAIFYGVFLIDEVPFKEKAKLEKEQLNKKNILLDFFDKKHVAETFRVAFKKGEHQRRLRVIMLMIVVMVVIGPLHGEISVTYLFTRYKFNWSEVEFSLFSTYGMLTSLVGTMVSVGVFSHMLKIDDALIGVMSSMSKILSSFVYAFAETVWQLYLGPIVEILNGTSFIAMRSMASKLVSSDELGKVNSLFGVAEALMPLVYAPMYTTLYSATLKTLPGAFFLLGGALTIPAVIIFLWMYGVNKKEILRKELEEKSKQIEIENRKLDKLSFSNKLEKHNNNSNVATITSFSEKSSPNLNYQRMGSQRRKTIHGVTNHAFDVNEDDHVLHETIEIVKELPALHLEHCKL